MSSRKDDPKNPPGLPTDTSRDQYFAQLRGRAEREARAFKSPEVDAQWPAEARRVVHELRVHQIELEMQNEELRSAREQLDASRARQFDLYDLAPVGYLTLSKAGLHDTQRLRLWHRHSKLRRPRTGLHGAPLSISMLLFMAMLEAPDIPGAADVVAWFGYWPSFHDAEVLSITLDRSHPSRIAVHTWNRTQEVDARGYYVLDKHAIVTFVLEDFLLGWEGITNTQIDGFNHQNVLSSVTVRKTLWGYDLVLNGIYGVSGSISVGHLRVELAPGRREPLIGRYLDTE